MTRGVAILGATGSVGGSTLDLIERAPDRFRVTAVTAATKVDELAAIARRTGAELAVITNERLLPQLSAGLAGTGCRPAAGTTALEQAAVMGDIVVAAIVGCAGLSPVMAAVKSGRPVALANKEALVTAGALMIDAARASGSVLIPVDSEHNAIFQCLAGSRSEDVERIILTASGGPFRTATAEAMMAATPAQAVAHPNWTMGAKISVDSATMMNKGLELIEAHYLFGLRSDQIDIVVHPQSVVHSVVGFRDGSMLAQLGSPDMRIPIAYALAYPERMAAPAERLDLAAIGRLEFEQPDLARFPALRLARESLEGGGAAPIVLNAANEVGVAGFLAGRIRFTAIARLVDDALQGGGFGTPKSIDDVLAIDAEVRKRVGAMMTELCD